MSGARPRALLAVPGDLATPSGGYGYARRLLQAAPGEGLILRHWPLPGGFPRPSEAALAEAERRLALLPAGWPVLIDGLALGVLSPDTLRAAGTPVIALCHHPLALETGLSEAEAGRLEASERAALGACAHVVATSRATAAILAERYGVAEDRLTVAPPGTDPAPKARGSGEAAPVLLSVGSLTPRKGHDVLLAALARLADLPWRLDIAGPAADADCAAALAAEAREAGLEGRVRFLGAADADRLAALYDRADLFVLASRYEGFGMAYAEALGRGLPVVGSDVPAIAEATRGAALLVPPGDAEELVAALRPLLAEPGARAALAERAAAAAPGLPGWGETAAKVAGAVSAVLAGR